MTYETNRTIAFVASFLITAVAIVMTILVISHNVRESTEHYYTNMNRCIDVGGTWVPSKVSAACIINNR
jgi:hypothetical protein